MKLHMVTIIPWAGARYYFLHRRVFDLANARQLVAQDFPLCLQLFIVWKMLVMTSAAHAKMDTARFNSLRGRVKYLYQFPACKVALLLCQMDTDALARQAKRHKDRATTCPRQRVIEASHCVSTIGECCQSNDVFHQIKRATCNWVAQTH